MPIGIALGVDTLAAATIFPTLKPIIIPTRFVGLLSDSFLILAAPLFILAGGARPPRKRPTSAVARSLTARATPLRAAMFVSPRAP